MKFDLITIIAAAAYAVLGFGLGLLCCVILNKIPAKWLCDYEEEPTEELLSGKRYNVKKHGSILGLILAVVMAAITLTNGVSVQQTVMMLMCFLLALISAADTKYQIIPDQFTIAAAVAAVAFAVVDILTTNIILSKWYEPLLGIAAGAGLLVILDVFSMLVLKKEGFGFGDIKLLAALGIMFGWKYSLVLIIAASLVAAVHFIILIFAGNGKIAEDKYLPMAPYLCIGAVVTLISMPWFERLFELYKAVLEMDTLP